MVLQHRVDASIHGVIINLRVLNGLAVEITDTGKCKLWDDFWKKEKDR